MKRRAATIAILVLVGLSCAACGMRGRTSSNVEAGAPTPSAGAHDASVPSAPAVPGPAQAVVSTIMVGDSHIQANPPEALDVPSISSQQAYDAYRKLGLPDFEKLSGKPAVILLSRASDSDLGDIRKDGSVALRVQNRLAWLLTFSPIPCQGSGGGGHGPSDPTAPKSCQFSLLVDATTGQAIESMESPAT